MSVQRPSSIRSEGCAATAQDPAAALPAASSWVTWLCGASAVALTFATFLPVLANGFVNWDDPENFLDNPHFRGLGWANLRWMFTTMLLGHYVPLSWMTLGLNYVLGGMSPWGYHLGNLLLHAANTALFFLVARRLLAAALAETPRSTLDAGAAVAAMAFGVHPLRVESVAWATERRDVLCGLFFLASVLAYVRGVEGGAGRRAIGTRWWGLSVVAFVLAMLSKAAAMPLPAVLLLLDIYPLRRVGRAGWGRLVIEKAPYLAAAGAGALLALIAQTRVEAVAEYRQYGIGARIAMTGYSLIFYPWKFLWPTDLSPLTALPAAADLSTARFVLPTILTALVTAGLLLLGARFPGLLAAWVYSAMMVLPVSGLVVHAGVQLVADRYSYLSGLGLALLTGAAFAWILRERRRFKTLVVGAVMVGAVLVIGGWAADSRRQSEVWKDSETLWRYALAIDPQSAFAHFQLGAALSAVGRTEEARTEIERAVELLPDQFANNKAGFHAALGLLLQQQKDLRGAERNYRAALRFSEDNVVALNNLGVIYALRGDQRAALDLFVRVLRVIPGYATACLNARALATALGVTPPELGRCPARD